MTYRFTEGAERWKIDVLKHDPLGRWQLYHAVNEAWCGLRLFPTVQDAMAAVAHGKTGVDSWDAAPHSAVDFTEDKWSTAQWGPHPAPV